MKWLIASDLHGSYYYTKKLFASWQAERADRMLLLGDLLYHGPRNDLPAEYDPKAVIELLNEHKSDLLCVRGNCEAEVDQMVLQFPVLADYALLSLSSRLIFATHGHHFHKDNPPPLRPGDILLHGHTHVPAWEPFRIAAGTCYYFNPGSISIPKNGSHHGYLILEEGGSDEENRFSWKDLDGGLVHTCTLPHTVNESPDLG